MYSAESMCLIHMNIYHSFSLENRNYDIFWQEIQQEMFKGGILLFNVQSPTAYTCFLPSGFKVTKYTSTYNCDLNVLLNCLKRLTNFRSTEWLLLSVLPVVVRRTSFVDRKLLIILLFSSLEPISTKFGI